jgi:hypothetical protein
LATAFADNAAEAAMAIFLRMAPSTQFAPFAPEELLDWFAAQRAAGQNPQSYGFAALLPAAAQAHRLMTNQKAYRKPGEDFTIMSYGMLTCTTIIVTGKLYFGTCAYVWHVPSGDLNLATLNSDLEAHAFPYARNQWVCTLVASNDSDQNPALLRDQANRLTESGVRDENIIMMINSAGTVGLGPNRELRYG